MKNIVINFYLLWGAWQDFREKKISVTYLKVGVVLGLILLLYDFFNKQVNSKEMILSFLPGIIFICISKITKEKIGIGDGLVFLLIGIFWGEKTWMLWQTSLVLSSLYSFIMIVAKKSKLENQIAFIPFVWLGHFLLWSFYYD